MNTQNSRWFLLDLFLNTKFVPFVTEFNLQALEPLTQFCWEVYDKHLWKVWTCEWHKSDLFG
jgi:hypothetical protein